MTFLSLFTNSKLRANEYENHANMTNYEGGIEKATELTTSSTELESRVINQVCIMLYLQDKGSTQISSLSNSGSPTVTIPRCPSTVTFTPSCNNSDASLMPLTQGIPSSRAIIAP